MRKCKKDFSKVAWIYTILTFIKFFTANIYLVREEDPTIYFKFYPTIANTFYSGINTVSYQEKYSWYRNHQYWEIFHSPGGMQDVVEFVYNVIIFIWWATSVAFIIYFIYRLFRRIFNT